MAGQLVPVVMFPRFTGLIGATTYNSLAIDVAAFSELKISIWRSPIVSNAGSGAFSASVVESIDRDSWEDAGSTQHVDPGTNFEQQYVFPLSRRWMRMQIVLGGTDPATTLWASGFLVKRER